MGAYVCVLLYAAYILGVDEACAHMTIDRPTASIACAGVLHMIRQQVVDRKISARWSASAANRDRKLPLTVQIKIGSCRCRCTLAVKFSLALQLWSRDCSALKSIYFSVRSLSLIWLPHWLCRLAAAASETHIWEKQINHMKKDLGVYMPISIHGEHGSAIHEDGEEATFIKKHRGRIIVFFRWPCALDLSNKIEEVWEN
jgi:hypothetical protein